MSSLPTFINGQQGSASQVMEAFNYLYDLGETNLNTLTTIRTNTLIEFNRRISYLNSKQQHALSLVSSNVLANFSITDFSTVDQSETTATVRIDSNTVSSAEQSVEVEAIVKSISFNTNIGSIEVLNQNSNVYRVYNTKNQTPTGTFLITLTNAVNLSILVFDLPAMASNPNIQVNVSSTNVLFTPCINYVLNGYRLVVYLNPAPIKYIQLVITPAVPDNLGGSLFTFGVTDFVGTSTLYRLQSEFVSSALSFTPTSLNCGLQAVSDPGLLYFLSLNGQNFIEIQTNTPISIPGVSLTNNTNVSLNSSGLLSQTLLSNTYKNTLKILDNSTQLEIPIIYGLATNDANIPNLTKSYVSIIGNSLYYIPYVSGDSSKTFTVSFLSGPPFMNAILKVQLSTSSNNFSPIFNGATLLPV